MAFNVNGIGMTSREGASCRERGGLFLKLSIPKCLLFRYLYTESERGLARQGKQSCRWKTGP
jgi:hypothetical protein